MKGNYRKFNINDDKNGKYSKVDRIIMPIRYAAAVSLPRTFAERLRCRTPMLRLSSTHLLSFNDPTYFYGLTAFWSIHRPVKVCLTELNLEG